MEVAQAQPVKLADPLDFSGFKPTRTTEGVITQDANAQEIPAEIDATKPLDNQPAAEVADDLTEEERILAGIEEEKTEAPAFTDDFKKALKEYTGYEDPQKFQVDYNTQREESRLMGEELKSLREIKGRLDKLSPQMLKALQMEWNKTGDGHKFIRSLPDPEVLNQDPKKLSDKQVLDFVDDHGITDEHWKTLNDPDADPGERDAIKRRIGFLRLNGEDTIRKMQEQNKADAMAEQAAVQAQQERWSKGVAAAVAKAKEGPLKTFVTPQHIDEIRSGKFISRLFEDDGVTPKPELLETLIKAEKYDSAREAAKKAGYKKGKADGLAEATSGMPTSPRAGRATATPNTNLKTNAWASTLDKLEASIR